MAFRKRRNIETEKYVARKQAAVMGGIDADALTRLIDAKGGDYYRADLNPTPGAREAYENLGMTQSNSPMFALQNQLLDEMRGYYGLNVPTQKAVAAPVPKPKAAVVIPTATAPQGPMPLQGPKAMQGPKQAEAQQLKEDYVNEIVGYDVQKRYEDIKKPKGFFIDDPLLEAALFGGAALGTGALGGAAISGNDEEERLKEAIEKGYILN